MTAEQGGPSPTGRRTFLLRTVAFAVASPLPGCAVAPSAPKRIPVVGFFPHDLARNVDQRAAFVDELRAAGYEDGKTLKIEWRNTQDGDTYEGALRMAAELVALRVDVLVANGGPAQRAAKQATTKIPTVIFNGNDPVAAGLVESLARPGGNITGIAGIGAIATVKRVELLKESFPKVSRLAIVGDADPTRMEQRTTAEDAARALGLDVVPLEVRLAADLPGALATATRRAADAVFFLPIGTLDSSYDKQLIGYAAARGIPASYWSTRLVNAGGLMFYGGNGAAGFRRAATYVVRILNGGNPAEMPIEQPATFDFVINLKTAKELGLVIPQSVLSRATRVIE